MSTDSTVDNTASFYNIPPEVLEDIRNFRAEMESFLKGEISPERFKPYRVSRGIYAQRGQETCMIRVKVPAGGLFPHQVDRIADLCERYGDGRPHGTTRQDVQIHYVKIEDTPTVYESLAEVGLTSKGGGGSTVRNVTACPDAGVCALEIFDVAPFSVAVTEHLIKHPNMDKLPRKFKVSFSGCETDCSLSTIQDVGFIAKRSTVDGVEREGFRLYTAGGMGANSKVGTLLKDFVPAEDVLYITEAIFNLFYEHGNRRNKHKARLRFFMLKVGEREFERLFDDEVARLKGEGGRELKLRAVPQPRGISPVGGDITVSADFTEREEYREWVDSNVIPQKKHKGEEGYYLAKIRLPLGDISSGDFRALAEIASGIGDGTLRMTHDQNIIIRWLNSSEVAALYNGIKGLGLAEPYAGGVSDLVSCPGASTCNLGICLSKNLASELTSTIEGSTLSLGELQAVDIKLSGCPNACGQHPIGAIGFFGAARRHDGRMAPHYEVLVGGRVEEGKTALGTQCGFIPSKAVPAFVNDLLGDYLETKLESEEGVEDFYDYLDRRGLERTKILVERYAPMPDFVDNSDFYADWGTDEEFSLAGLGAGECGVGVFDMIETDMEDARKALGDAGKMVSGGTGDVEGASEHLFNGLVLTCKSLLVTQGIEPTGGFDAINEYERVFIGGGHIDTKHSGLEKKGARYSSGLLDEGGITEGISYVEELLGDTIALYDSMDDALQFTGGVVDPEGVSGKKAAGVSEAPSTTPSGKKDEGQEAVSEGQSDADAFMDLRGVKCPINYVKSKIKLEMMDIGETMLLLLDDGEPIQNVPVSHTNDGQEILRMDNKGEYFELLIKKQA